MPNTGRCARDGMDNVKISVVIIAKNEEKKIALCLDSVKWADELIVVDGFSRDKTVEIAKSFGAKVIQHKFTGSFADDRNIGMENASNAWVLQLDADDIVSENFKVELEKALLKNEDTAVYKFRRKNFFLGHSMEHGGFHHYIPNLVNRTLVKFGGEVHEVPVHKGRVGIINADIEHHPFDSISQFIDRQNRYTDLAAKALFKKEPLSSNSSVLNDMLFKSFKIFWKSYIKKRGYKEKFYGFLFAVLFAFINFLKWAKYWEISKDRNK